MSIRELPRGVSQLISSSQVISSVSCVVKELVENSIDAGSTVIDIKLERNGLDRIEVRDNGSGINMSDIQNVCLPNYTSKIYNFDDLEHLRTYGFRGEALHSLCSVSQVCITTKTETDQVASTYTYDTNGTVREVQPSHQMKGTIVTVTELFRNVPVRRQFYESTRKACDELKKIEKVVKLLSVIHPKLRVTIAHNKCLIWQKTSVSSLRLSLMQMYPHIVLKNLVDFTSSLGGLSLEMLICKRDCNWSILCQPANEAVLFFINQRPVKDKKVEKVVMEEMVHLFASTLPPNKCPLTLISIQLPPEQLDVNVEPDKSRIFIKNHDEILEQIRESIILHFYEQPLNNEKREFEIVLPDLIDERVNKKRKIDDDGKKQRNKIDGTQLSLENVFELDDNGEKKISEIKGTQLAFEDVFELGDNCEKQISDINGTQLAFEDAFELDDNSEKKKSEINGTQLVFENMFKLDDDGKKQRNEINGIQLAFEDVFELDDNDEKKRSEMNGNQLAFKNVFKLDNDGKKQRNEINGTQLVFDSEKSKSVDLLSGNEVTNNCRLENDWNVMDKEIPERMTIDDNCEKQINEVKVIHENGGTDSNKLDPSKYFNFQSQIDPINTTVNTNKIFSQPTLSQWSRGNVKIGDKCLEGGAYVVSGTDKETAAEYKQSEKCVKPEKKPTPKLDKELSSVNVMERSVSSQMGRKDLAGLTNFARTVRTEIVNDNPGISFGKVASELANRWRNLDDVQKNTYTERAKASKNQKQSTLVTKAKQFIKKKTIFVNISVDNIAKHLKKSKHISSEKEFQLINSLRTKSEWLCRIGDTIAALNVAHLQENVIFHRYLCYSSIPMRQLDEPININAESIGNDLLIFLLSLERTRCDEDKYFFISDSRITKNGFKIVLFEELPDKYQILLTETTKESSFNAVENVIETLRLAKHHNDLQHCRTSTTKQILLEKVAETSRDVSTFTEVDINMLLQYWIQSMSQTQICYLEQPVCVILHNL